jgi:hypothetical protein
MKVLLLKAWMGNIDFTIKQKKKNYRAFIHAKRFIR